MSSFAQGCSTWTNRNAGRAGARKHRTRTNQRNRRKQRPRVWAVPEPAGGGARAVSCARYLYPQPGGNPGGNLNLISNRCHPILVAFVWELTKESINLSLGCLLGGGHFPSIDDDAHTLFLTPSSCDRCPRRVGWGARDGSSARLLWRVPNKNYIPS